MEIIYLIAGFLIGAAAIWLSIKNSKGISLAEGNQLKDQTNLANLEKEKALERLNILKENFEKVSVELKSERDKVIGFNSETSTLKAINKNLEEKLTEQKSELEKLQENFLLSLRTWQIKF